MLQRALLRMACVMAGAGLLGMLVAYSICGKIAGEYIGVRRLISPAGNALESADPLLAEVSSARARIFAGGAAGVLIGLAAPIVAGFGRSVRSK